MLEARQKRRISIKTVKNPSLHHTPAALTQALAARWQSPSPEQQEALGRRLWAEMLASHIGELVPRETFLITYSTLMSRSVARYLWQTLPREQILADAETLRASGQTLGDILGPETCALLREGAERPWKPNRELTEKLLDQPLLRNALKTMVQKSFQQFLGQISTLGDKGGTGSSGQAARGSVLGALGRSFANRAEKAVQIGKTFMEGMGGTLFHQLEDQIQPFLTGFMQRSVKLLTESLFSGEGQAELAQQTRLQMLEVLLATEVRVLLPEPESGDLDHTLSVLEALSARLTGLEGWQDALRTYLLAFYDALADQPLETFMRRNRLNLDADPAAYQALGQLGYHMLNRPSVLGFLEEELQAVWGGD